MGCLASKHGLISTSNGTEKDYHDRYLEDRTLGEGEFGVVRLVHDIAARNDPTSEPKACKVLRKGFTFKDNTLYAPLKPEVLQRECRILQTLRGEKFNLRLDAIFEGSNMLYLITELCAGGEMMEYVTEVYPDGIRTEDASRISFQLLSALDHCAQHRVMHRDVKPENVMFVRAVRGAELRLIDYGSGTIDDGGEEDGGDGDGDNGQKKEPMQEKALDSTSPDALITHTTFAGSAFYISPEMFQKKYTSRTDVWSAGATLYVLVAGYPADELQKAFNLLQKSKKRDLRTLPHMPQEMPESYYEMLDDLLVYRHKKRKSAGQILEGSEFVNFHKDHDLDGEGEEGEEEDVEFGEEGGLSLADVAAAAAVVGTTPNGSTGRGGSTRGKRTQSILIEGSVRRHAQFLLYGKFERALTTLLATVLSAEELTKLLDALESRIIVKEGDKSGIFLEKKKDEGGDGIKSNSSLSMHDSSHGGDNDVGAVEVLSNERKLQIVKVEELRMVLQELGLKEAVEMLNDLPNSSNYNSFAYHTALLREFAKNRAASRGGAGAGAAGGLTKAQSIYARNNGFDLSDHGKNQANSVHGGSVWAALKGGHQKRHLNRMGSSLRGSAHSGGDVLNSSSHM